MQFPAGRDREVIAVLRRAYRLAPVQCWRPIGLRALKGSFNPITDKDQAMGKHEEKDPKKGESDGSGPINPDTVREPKPGKRGQ